MARGDVTTVIINNMLQGDTTDRQPAAGVEELFMSGADVDVGGSAPDGGPALDLNLIDGTNNDADYFNNGSTGISVRMMYSGKYLADNTRFFRITHGGGNTGDYGFAIIAVG